MLVVEMGTVVALELLVLSLGNESLNLKLYVTCLLYTSDAADESLPV